VTNLYKNTPIKLLYFYVANSTISYCPHNLKMALVTDCSSSTNAYTSDSSFTSNEEGEDWNDWEWVLWWQPEDWDDWVFVEPWWGGVHDCPNRIEWGGLVKHFARQAAQQEDRETGTFDI
jgi:hypothetical protein